MNEQKIKKLLKKYDLDFKGRKFIEKQLINRKIHTRSIRNKIFTQGEKVTKLFCLLSGSVQISYILSHQMKAKHFENDEEKETIYKTSKTEHFKLTFLVIQNELEFINEEAILQLLQKQQKHKQFANQRQSLNISRQSSKQSHNRKKQDHIKSKYTATIASSQCQYIEVSFEEAQVLMNLRMQQIRQRDIQRQKLIKEKKRNFRLELEGNDRKFMLDKISMPNLHTKPKLNLSPRFKDVYNLAGFENKVLTSRYDFRLGPGTKEENDLGKILHQPLKKVRSVSNMISSKNGISSQNNIFENTFGSSEFLSTQNNQILQKYRQKQGLGNLLGNHKSNRLDTLLMPKKGAQDKIFKQNLKKIIRKKLKFERMHGDIIRENAYGIQGDVIEISEEYEYPIENGDTQSQGLIGYQQSDSLAPRLSSHTRKPQTIRVNPTFHNNTTKHSSLVNKHQLLGKLSTENPLRTARIPMKKNFLNHEFERQSNELNDLKKMRKKMEEHAMFLKLQDLDSYFKKI